MSTREALRHELPPPLAQVLNCCPSSRLPILHTARSMFLQTETTPNEDSIKFIPGQALSETGQTHEFLSSQDARKSPLATALFDIPGVRLVFFGPDFITVSKTEDVQWPLLKPEIYATIIDHFSNGKPLFFEGHNDADGPEDTRILDTDSEVVAMIKELLDTRVRPAIQEDGGDIEYKGFNEENGMVSVSLKGSCRGCDSSTVTLKSGIERMLMHYVSESRTRTVAGVGSPSGAGVIRTHGHPFAGQC